MDAQTRRAEIILRSNENDDLIREKELKEELEMKEKLRQRQLQQQSKPRGGPAPKKVEEKK